MKRPDLYLARTCFLALSCSLLAVTAVAQKKRSSILKYDHEAYEGRVWLTDGTIEEGGIVFNDNDGFVTVHQGQDSQTFNARGFIKFEFFDSQLDRLRRFYSLDFYDPDKGQSAPEIFEVLKELPDFAVLCKIDRIKTEVRRSIVEPTTSPTLAERANKKFTQTETVYFVTEEGDFQPYVRFLQKEISGDLLDYNENNTRVLDGDVFESFTRTHYQDLVRFARENKLSFRRKAHLIAILDEYERLLRK